MLSRSSQNIPYTAVTIAVDFCKLRDRRCIIAEALSLVNPLTFAWFRRLWQYTHKMKPNQHTPTTTTGYLPPFQFSYPSVLAAHELWRLGFLVLSGNWGMERFLYHCIARNYQDFIQQCKKKWNSQHQKSVILHFYIQLFDSAWSIFFTAAA